MRNYWRAGILLVLLAVPALFYIFLRSFTQNHYTLRRFIPVIDSTTGEPIMGKQVDERGKEVVDTVFRTVLPFHLIDQESKPTSNEVVKGKIHIADFFFTRCGTICPKLSSELSRVQDVFRNKSEVILLSFSIDPEHDTAAKLKAYAQKYDAISGKWYFLTGNKAEIYKLAQRGYFLPVVDKGVDYGKPDETFIHSEKLVLVDKSGYIRGFYDGTDKKDVDRLILETRVLLDIYSKQ